MKINVNTMKQQTQEFFLRLFVESSPKSTLPSDKYYICTHCGTFTRLHQ